MSVLQDSWNLFFFPSHFRSLLALTRLSPMIMCLTPQQNRKKFSTPLCLLYCLGFLKVCKTVPLGFCGSLICFQPKVAWHHAGATKFNGDASTEILMISSFENTELWDTIACTLSQYSVYVFSDFFFFFWGVTIFKPYRTRPALCCPNVEVDHTLHCHKTNFSSLAID